MVELLSKLRENHPEMKVLKLKKFIGPDAPQLVMDSILDALEENVGSEESNEEEELGMEDGMDEMLGAGDGRDRMNDMAEGDIDDMAEVDDDAELGLGEVMMEVMGAGDDGDERIDMAEAENDCRMTEGWNEVDIVGCGG